MWTKITDWFWKEFFGPLNKRRFKFRIGLRVQWLFFKRWREETSALRGFLSFLWRPILLLLIGIGLPFFIYWAWNGFFPEHPVLDPKKLSMESQVTWRAIAQPLILLVAAPAAFILWAFRDRNAQANLSNQRKDINLKEFQEIQMRAAGALDEKLPKKARQTMQIAAIHQLRPFLRGEYGASFRRPAWELLKARLAISAEESGYSAIRQWVEQGKFSVDENETPEYHAQRIRAEIRRNINAISPDPVTLAERALIAEERGQIFRTDLPVRETRFGGMGLSGALLSKLDLHSASFIGANLSDAHLEGANLIGAHLEGAVLIGAHLEGADLAGARFGDNTALTWGWQDASPDQKATLQKKLRKLGARHVDDLRNGQSE